MNILNSPIIAIGFKADDVCARRGTLELLKNERIYIEDVIAQTPISRIEDKPPKMWQMRLRERYSRATTPELLERLRDERWYVRRAAMEALAQSNVCEAIPHNPWKHIEMSVGTCEKQRRRLWVLWVRRKRSPIC